MLFKIGINGRSAGATGRYMIGSMVARSRWCAFLGILYGDVGIWSILASRWNVNQICTGCNQQSNSFNSAGIWFRQPTKRESGTVLLRFGMIGAGKSVIIANLLAQIGHRFGFRLIVEEGLSHAVFTQTQGCEPVIINPPCCAIVKDLWRSMRPGDRRGLVRGGVNLWQQVAP
jgi:hypothetical protein